MCILNCGFNPTCPVCGHLQRDDNFLTHKMQLDNLGAPGFSLNERVDFSGHSSGRVDPHLNTDLINPSGRVVKRDLTKTQLPGFNKMQDLF